MNRILPRLLTKCTCSNRQILISTKSFSSTSIPFTSSSTTTTQLPWFITEPTPSESIPSTSTRSISTPFIPLPPPNHIPSTLHPLYNYLSISPFLNPTNIKFINAKECDPEGSWTEWVVVTSLKKGREGGLRGAIEGVRTYLVKSPIPSSSNPSPTPFSPPSSKPIISGLPTPPSKHSRSRTGGISPSRMEQASGWGILDSGNVVVHVMTEESRLHWGLEGLWEGVKRENERTIGAGLRGDVVEEEEREMLEFEDVGNEKERKESEADEWEKK